MRFVRDGFDIKSEADYEKYLRGNFPEHVGLTSKNVAIVKEEIVEELAVLIKTYLTE